MYDLISILLDYVEALPPTPDMDRVSEESFPFLQRLYQLTGEDEADRIWGAAMEVGASEGRQMLLTGLALGIPLVGGFHLSAKVLAAYLVCSCVVGVAAASFSTMLAMLVPNRAVGLVVGILLALALLFVGQSLMATLLEPETVQKSTQIVENGQVAYLTEYGAPMVPNSDYIQGVPRMLCTFFLYFLPTSQCFAVAFTTLDHPGLLTLGALFTVLTTGVGLVLFVRKDVK